MEWNLLEKTTFWVEGAELTVANLDDVAAAVGGSPGLGVAGDNGCGRAARLHRL